MTEEMLDEKPRTAAVLERRTVTHVQTGVVYVRLQVVGERGGVEFHFACYPEPLWRANDSAWQSMGVETHWKADNRPDYYADAKPSHSDCTITGGDCWHDGTSMWASEYWMPQFRISGPEWAFARLEMLYRETFEGEAP